MKIKHLFFAVTLLSTAPLFYACNDDDDNGTEIPKYPEEDPSSEPETGSETILPTGSTTTGLYVINAGSLYNNINGSLSLIDYQEGIAANDTFQLANKRSLGATAQDAVVYGSKMYIAVYGSNVIEVVDKNTVKSIKQIRPTSAQGKEPRDIVAGYGKVYVSMYDGYVSRIDTASLTIDATIPVGPNPEEMTIANGYLYVTNSDGLNYGANYDNGKSVSKIGLKTFTEAKRIPVGLNPTKICSTAEGNVYVIAVGNYDDIPAKVQKIDKMNNVTDVTEATLMAVKDNTLYLINAPYGAASDTYTYFSIDTKTGNETKELVNQVVDSPCNIAVDPITGKIYISSYNMVGGYISYSTDGYVNEYSPSGEFIKRYDVGVGPCGLSFLLN